VREQEVLTGDYCIDSLEPALAGLRSSVSRIIVQIASACVQSPVIELKIFLARRLPEIARLNVLCADRQRHILSNDTLLDKWVFDVSSIPPLPINASSADLMQIISEESSKLELLFDSLLSCDAITDSAACRILDEESSSIGALGAEVCSQLKNGLNPGGCRWSLLATLLHEPLTTHRWLWEGLPAKLTRDSRFDRPEDTAPRTLSSSAGADIAARYHRILMETEIPTIEACAANLILANHCPLHFLLDMCRQACDEARHADACICIVRDHGYELGSFNSTTILWALAHELPLVGRLAIHQRIGETLGVNSAYWRTRYYRKELEIELSNVEKMIYLDEVTHVAIGNRWIRYFCDDNEDLVRAAGDDATQLWLKMAGEIFSGARKYPIDAKSMELAGYTKEEIDRLIVESEALVRMPRLDE
jgi:uncharacterized ferritin-like protein (DUF455 family)